MENPYPCVAMTPEQDAMILSAEHTDAELAQMFSVSENRIRNRRQRLMSKARIRQFYLDSVRHRAEQRAAAIAAAKDRREEIAEEDREYLLFQASIALSDLST